MYFNHLWFRVLTHFHINLTPSKSVFSIWFYGISLLLRSQFAVQNVNFSSGMAVEASLFSSFFPLTTTEPSRPRAGNDPRRSCALIAEHLGRVKFFFFFSSEKSGFVMAFWSAKAHTHTDAHTSGITAQTWRQCVTNSPLPLCHSAAPLEQMGDECWRDERTLFINSFSFFLFFAPRLPTFSLPAGHAI